MTEFHVSLNVIIKERKPSWCRKKATRIHSSSSVWSLGILKEERRSILDARRRLEQHSDGTWRVWESKNGRENGTQETKTREMDGNREGQHERDHACPYSQSVTDHHLPYIQSPIENIEKRQNNSPMMTCTAKYMAKTNNLPFISLMATQVCLYKRQWTNERTSCIRETLLREYIHYYRNYSIQYGAVYTICILGLSNWLYYTWDVCSIYFSCRWHLFFIRFMWWCVYSCNFLPTLCVF